LDVRAGTVSNVFNIDFRNKVGKLKNCQRILLDVGTKIVLVRGLLAGNLRYFVDCIGAGQPLHVQKTSSIPSSYTNK
jgi:hypothetical protein